MPLYNCTMLAGNSLLIEADSHHEAAAYAQCCAREDRAPAPPLDSPERVAYYAATKIARTECLTPGARGTKRWK